MAVHALSSLVVALLASYGHSAGFTPGNIVVLRAGSVGTPFTPGQSAVASLVEYDTNGNVVQTVGMPASASGANLPFSLSADDALAGYMSRSDDGQFLMFGGIAAPPGTPNPDSTNSNLTARGIARINMDGTVDTSLSINGAFSGDGGAGGGRKGGIRCVASDNGVDVFVAGYDTVAGSSILIINGTGAGAGTIPLAAADLSSCTVYDNRLLGVTTGGSIVAIEDLHSIEPGLPDALFDPAFAPTVRTLSDGSHDSAGGSALAFVGHGGASTIYAAHATSCLSAWAFIDSTPTDYVLDSGYLSAGLDILPGPDFCLPLTVNAAKQMCSATPTCAGFSFFYNASLGPNPTPPGGKPGPQPYDPSMAIWTFLKGPFFYYTHTGTDADWITYQKPATSGNFNFKWQSTTSTMCSPNGAGIGLFAVAADTSTNPPILYGTSKDGQKLIQYNTGTGSVKVLATASAGTVFRGIAMAPTRPVPSTGPTPGNNGAGGGAGGPGAVAAGVIIPLLLLGAIGGYLFVYHKDRTLSVLQSIIPSSSASSSSSSSATGKYGVGVGIGGTARFKSAGGKGAERMSLLSGATVPAGLPGPGATVMPAAALVPSPEHVKARTRTLSAVATRSPPKGAQGQAGAGAGEGGFQADGKV